MPIQDEVFRTDLFDTTYQDMAGENFRVELISEETLYTGLADTVNTGVGSGYAVSYTVPLNSNLDTRGTIQYLYENPSTGIAFKTAGSAMTYFLANFTAGVDYVDGSETEFEFGLSEHAYSIKMDMNQPGIEMTWNGTFDRYNPINGSSCTISFKVTEAQADILDNALLRKEGNLRIRIWKDTDIFWYGYALPETVASTIDEGRVDYDITFTDGLGLLASKPFIEDDGTEVKRQISVLDAIHLCLQKIPSNDLYRDDTTNVYSQEYIEVYGAPQKVRNEATTDNDGNPLEGNYNFWDVTTDDPFATTFFWSTSVDSLVKKDKKDVQHHGKVTQASCLDVLKNILMAFGMEICLFNGHWVIYSRPEMLENYAPKRWTYYWAKTSGEISTGDANGTLSEAVTALNSLQAALSTRKVVYNYDGPLLRAVNVSTLVEQDIWPDKSGRISFNTIEALGNGQNVAVTMWFDQSGKGRHAKVVGYDAGTWSINNCPLIAEGNSIDTTVNVPTGYNSPMLIFDGINDSFTIDSAVVDGTTGRTLTAGAFMRYDGSTSINTIVCQPKDGAESGNGIAWAFSMEDLGSAQFRLTNRVYGNEIYTASNTLLIPAVVSTTLPDSSTVADFKAYLNGTELSLDSSSNPTQAIDTSTTPNETYIGRYQLNAATAATYYFDGEMAEVIIYDDFRDDLRQTIEDNTTDYLDGTVPTVTEAGLYPIEYIADATYSGKNLSDYGAISKRANKKFNIATRSVKLEHKDQGGDILFSTGHRAFGSEEANWGQGHTPLIASGYNSYDSSFDTLEVDSTNRLGYTTAGNAYVDPTTEGTKLHLDNWGRGGQRFRTSGKWKRSDELSEWQNKWYNVTNPWKDATNYLQQGTHYNGRYVGPRSQTITDLNLEAGTPIKIALEGVLNFENTNAFTKPDKTFVAGSVPVFRARVEVQDKDGNKWRLFRPVRTYDQWSDGSEHQIPIKTTGSFGGTQINYSEFKGIVENDGTGASDTDYFDGTVGASRAVGYYYVVNSHDNDYDVQVVYWTGTVVSPINTAVLFENTSSNRVPYYIKDEDNDGDATYGNWIPHPDNNITNTATTAQWDDAWFEVLGNKDGNVREKEGYEFTAKQLEFKGYAPMNVKHITGDDETDQVESFEWNQSDDRNRCLCVGNFEVDLPGTLGETEIEQMYVEFGTELFAPMRGPRPVGSYAKEPVGAGGLLNGFALLRSANADGTGGYNTYMGGSSFYSVSSSIQKFGVTSFSLEVEGEDRATSYLSYADGGKGEEGMFLGSTIFGARFSGFTQNTLGRLTGYLMNEEGALEGVGWHRLKWRRHHDTDTIEDALAAGQVWTSLHELVTWQWLNMTGQVRKVLMVDTLPTVNMNLSGPVCPYLPMQQDNLLSNVYGITSQVMPGRITWSLGNGNRIDMLELGGYEAFSPFSGSDSDYKPDTVGVSPTKPSVSPVSSTVNFGLPFISVQGSGSGSYSNLTEDGNDHYYLGGSGHYGTPSAQYQMNFTDGEVEILESGMYSITASADIRSDNIATFNDDGDIPHLNVYKGTSTGFTINGLSKLVTITKGFASTAEDEEQHLSGAVVVYLEAGDFIKFGIESLDRSGTAEAWESTKDSTLNGFAISGVNIIQNTDYGETIPSAPSFG